MSFHTSKDNGVVLVDVDGQLIVGNRQELKQKVLDQLEAGERKFLIDFASTGYIVGCWLRAGVLEPLLMLPAVLAARLAYSMGLAAGGVRWIRYGTLAPATRARWE